MGEGKDGILILSLQSCEEEELGFEPVPHTEAHRGLFLNLNVTCPHPALGGAAMEGAVPDHLVGPSAPVCLRYHLSVLLMSVETCLRYSLS